MCPYEIPRLWACCLCRGPLLLRIFFVIFCSTFFFRLCSPLSFRRNDISYFSFNLAIDVGLTVQNYERSPDSKENIVRLYDEMLKDESRHPVKIQIWTEVQGKLFWSPPPLARDQHLLNLFRFFTTLLLGHSRLVPTMDTRMEESPFFRDTAQLTHARRKPRSWLCEPNWIKTSDAQTSSKGWLG